jgi:hypothetical protein
MTVSKTIPGRPARVSQACTERGPPCRIRRHGASAFSLLSGRHAAASSLESSDDTPWSQAEVHRGRLGGRSARGRRLRSRRHRSHHEEVAIDAFRLFSDRNERRFRRSRMPRVCDGKMLSGRVCSAMSVSATVAGWFSTGWRTGTGTRGGCRPLSTGTAWSDCSAWSNTRAMTRASGRFAAGSPRMKLVACPIQEVPGRGLSSNA